jgi:hypothetical protein
MQDIQKIESEITYGRGVTSNSGRAIPTSPCHIAAMVTFHVLAVSPRFGVEAWHVFAVGTDGRERPMVTFSTETDAQALADSLTVLEAARVC